MRTRAALAGRAPRLPRAVALVLLTLLAGFPTRQARAQQALTSRHRALVTVSVLYLANAGAGTWLAVRDSLPGQPFGWQPTANVRHAAFESGTGLSPGVPMLITQLASTVLSVQPGRAGRLGTRLLVLHGAAYFIGGVAEPVTYRTLRHSRAAGAARTIVVIGNLLLPTAIIAAGK